MASRITSNMLTSNYLRNMKRNLTNMKSLQNQLASGKQIQKASENPYVASRSMQLNADISYNKQYDENIKDTSNWLDTTDTALSQVGNVFGRIETLLVNAGNGSYGEDEKNAIRDEVKEKVNELSQILNTNFDGSYIFGGTKTGSKPTKVQKVNDNVVLQYADEAGNAIEINAYKDSSGNITSDKSSVQNTSVGAITGLPTDPTGGLITERNNTTTSAERKADINALLGGAAAYYTGTITPAPDPIPVSQLTSEKYVTNIYTASLSDAQKSALAIERDSSATSEDRKNDITKLLQGAQAYEVVDPATRLGTGVFTSEKYLNTQVTLSASSIVNLQKELNDKLTIPADAARVDDINSILYDTTKITVPSPAPTGFTGSTSLDYIKFLETNIKSGTASSTDFNTLNAASKFMNINQINSDLIVDISQGVSSNYNQTAISIMEFTDKSGKTINVSQLLTNIITDLGTNGNATNLTTAHLKDIQSVTSNLLQKRSEVGTMQNRMDSAQQNNETQNYDMTDILSKTEDIDFAEATMNYSMMQTVYTAALQTSAKILPMTILSYL